METSNQKIPDIFANNYFRIPDYQRGYAWKADKQLPDLWDDIEDIPTNPSGGYKPHYTGAISLQKTSFDKLSKSEQKLLQSGSNIYDVVDGQQRLTTILILLFELYKKLNDKKIYNQYIKKRKVRMQSTNSRMERKMATIIIFYEKRYLKILIPSAKGKAYIPTT